MNGVISRNVLIFGLGISPQSLVDLVDPASPVALIDGEVEGFIAQRCERERLALNHPGVPVDPVPPGELDLLSSPVEPGQTVATNDVCIDEEGRGLPQARTRATWNTVCFVEARELCEHRFLGVPVVVL